MAYLELGSRDKLAQGIALVELEVIAQKVANDGRLAASGTSAPSLGRSQHSATGAIHVRSPLNSGAPPPPSTVALTQSHPGPRAATKQDHVSTIELQPTVFAIQLNRPESVGQLGEHGQRKRDRERAFPA